MKRMLVVGLLAFAVMASAQQQTQPTPGVTITQEPINPTPNQQPGQPGQPAPQQKTIKDPAEYNAYIGALNAQDPAQKISLMEAFLNQYPNSVVKEDGLVQLMAAYQQSNNQPKVLETAQRALQVNPNNVRALALLAYLSRAQAEGGQNAQQNAELARQYGDRGLQALQTKPAGMAEKDFEELKKGTLPIFAGAAGFGALQAKDYAAAQRGFSMVIQTSPDSLRDVYPLALSYLEAQPPAWIDGLWYAARAAALAQRDLANNPQAQKAISDYGRSKYRRYHGDEEGWQELIQQASATAQKPADLHIEPAPSPAEVAANVLKTNHPKDLAFGDWEFILASGNPQAADQVWSHIQSLGLMKLRGKVIQASPDRILVAVGKDYLESNTADVEVNLSKPAKVVPQPGKEVTFIGKADTFTPEPFLISMAEGELEAPKAPARPARRARKR